VVSQSAVDRALATRDQARARKLSAEAKLAKQQAQIGSARAQVQSRRAALNERRLDLERTVIRSPVAGVVIGRNVELGQTVAASLQAPVLFTIAEDLKRMQVEVSVDEADIGRLRERQRERVTVDAYVRRNFSGQVRQIRKAPNVVSNVVTYTVIVGAENPDLALLPGMTANVEVIVGARKDVLKVPSAALRFRPKAGAAASQASSGGGGGGREAARARGRALFQRLNKTLGLNEEQQSVIGAIFRETGQAIGALRQAGGQPETMRQAVRGLRAQASRRIAALLDDEQKRRYAEMLAEAAVTTSRGQVWRLGPDGQPLAIPVVSGISDSSMTEIVRGELKAGQPVIVGRAFGSGR
jgi:HlyD family secretion protein